MGTKKSQVSCPYCGEHAQLVSGKEIYPHRPDLHALPIYACLPCEAYVGCHPGTMKPLGRLANAELRKAKMAAHTAFDPIWKSGQMKRKQAYRWLAELLGIEVNDCHIGEFDVEMCRKVVSLCRCDVASNCSAGA